MPNDRLVSNRLILSLLSEAVEKNPDMRFHQILQNFGVEVPNSDQFYEESSKTLSDLAKEYDKLAKSQCKQFPREML